MLLMEEDFIGILLLMILGNLVGGEIGEIGENRRE